MSATAPPKGQKYPRTASHKETIRQQREEIDALRKRVNLNRPTDLQAWGVHAPQALRDRIAAAALIAERLDELRALIRLGFHVELPCEPGGYISAWTPEVQAMAEAVFGPPGVKENLALITRDLNENWTKHVARLQENSLHGDPDISVRAMGLLVKIADKDETAKHPSFIGGPDQRTVNLFLMAGTAREASDTTAALADPDRIVNAADLLANDPGEAVMVPDEEPEYLDHRR